MPAKDHAAWDLLTVLVHAPSRVKAVAPGEYRPLSLARTAFLDPGADPARIRETYQQRTKSTEPMRLAPAEIIGVVLLGLAALAVGLGLWGGWTALQPSIFAMVFISAMATYARDRNLRMLRRTMNRFLERHCPDCNYDLSASHPQPPLDPNTLGINLGPCHCPECGALWPLVPPEPPPQP